MMNFLDRLQRLVVQGQGVDNFTVEDVESLQRVRGRTETNNFGSCVFIAHGVGESVRCFACKPVPASESCIFVTHVGR